MDTLIIGGLGSMLGVLTFILGFASLRRRAHLDRAIALQDNVSRDLIRAGSDLRTLSDDEVLLASKGLQDAATPDTVAEFSLVSGAVVYLTMLLSIPLVGRNSTASFTWAVSKWDSASILAGALVVCATVVLGAGILDRFAVRSDLQKRTKDSVPTQMDSAISSFKHGDFAAATATVETLRNTYPSWVWPISMQGAIYLKIGEYEQSEAAFLLAIQMNPQEYTLRIARAEVLYEMKNYAAALDELNHGSPVEQDLSRSLKLRAALHYELGDRTAAVAAWTKILESSPSNIEALLGRTASTLLSTDVGREERAVAIEEIVDDYGDDILGRSTFGFAKSSLSRSEVTHAIEDLNFVVQLEGPRRAPILLRATCHLRSGDTASAETDFELALELSSTPGQRAEILEQRANMRAAQGNFTDAQADIQAATAILDRPRFSFARARFFGLAGSFSEAIETLDSTTGEITPILKRRMALKRAEFVWKSGKQSESREALELIIQDSPSNPDAHIKLIELYHWSNDITRAREAWERARTSCDSSSVKLMDAGLHIALSQRSFAEAEELLELSKSSRSADEYYLNLAQILGAQRKYDEALKLVTPISQRPGQARQPALMMRAILLSELGSHENALAIVEEALSLGNNRAGVLGVRALVSKAAGLTEESLEDLREAVEIEPTSYTAWSRLSTELFAREATAESIAAGEMCLTLAARGGTELGIAQANIRAHRWTEAAKCFSSLHTRDPENSRYISGMATAYMNAGDAVAAEHWFKKLVELTAPSETDPEDDGNNEVHNSFRLAHGIAVLHLGHEAPARKIVADVARSDFQTFDHYFDLLNFDVLPKPDSVLRLWELVRTDLQSPSMSDQTD